MFQFEPLTGPKEGGTNLTITGQSLGKLFEHIKDGVYVADVQCIPYRHLYVPTTGSVHTHNTDLCDRCALWA